MEDGVETTFSFSYYDLKLKLRLHLGKDLREVKGFIRSGKV